MSNARRQALQAARRALAACPAEQARPVSLASAAWEGRHPTQQQPARPSAWPGQPRAASWGLPLAPDCLARGYAHSTAAQLRDKHKQHACWNCDAHLLTGSAAFFCPACKALQPVDRSLDYFTLMGIGPPRFDVDPGELEQAYKGLQKRLHPDKYSQSPQLEREYSADQAAQVNQAYATLRSPLHRALYLLELAGTGPAQGGEGTIDDAELLMEVMEAREAVEAAEDPGELARLRNVNHIKETALLRDLSDAFRAGDLGAAQQLVVQLRYVTRLGEALLHKL